jgi:Protein of unknown function (DUF1761)
MPRLARANLVAVFAAAVAIFSVGSLFYGLIFAEVWQQQFLENHGAVALGEGPSLTGQALRDALLAVPGQMPMGAALGFGFVLSLLMAFGLASAFSRMKPASLGAALGIALLLWLGFVVPVLGYNIVYYGESRIDFAIDLGHTLVALLAGAAVIFLIDGKALKA